MNEKEVVEKLENTDLKHKFLESYSATAMIRPRLYQVIVERMPITFDVGSEAQLQKLEDANYLKDYQIAQARWIKPLNC